MKYARSFGLRLLSAAVLIGLAPGGQAACPLDGVTPMNIGAPNSIGTPPETTTVPLWVQDSEGLAVEVCPGTDQLNCISLPPDDPLGGNPASPEELAFAASIGFGEEAFYASAEALITIPAGRALMVSAIEIAYLNGFSSATPPDTFTRLRIRVDIDEAGTYVVTTPWGQKTYLVTAADVGPNAINDTVDLPFVADQVGFVGALGPILTWDTFPDDPLLDQYGPPFRFDPPFGDSGPDGVADYIGTLNFVNPVTGGPEHAVKGSPCGTNFFRVEGPNIGGPGIDVVETDLFAVTGKIFNGASLPTPLTIDQATYSRSAAGRVNVFATAPTQATVSFAGGANLPAGDQPMTGDGSGRFFGSVALTPDAATVPANITVTADNGAIDPDNLPTDLTVPLIDLVTITRAEYDYASGDLTIEARSSDLATPPTLSALGQTLTGGLLTVNTTVAPPAVTVTSSAGGSATVDVTVIHAP
jgi:hypothetical protein